MTLSRVKQHLLYFDRTSNVKRIGVWVWVKNPNVTLVHQNTRFYLGSPDPPLKVLKVLKLTVSRESFWNHSIKKWSDTTSSFILNDNSICFIAFLGVFSTKMINQKKNTKNRNPGRPPLPF